MDKINQVKLDKDLLDHNKLRFYKQLKGSFKIEPYIENIQNRSQRSWLSRYHVSAHKLRIETGRYTRPVTPVCDRVCVYCDSLDVTLRNILYSSVKHSHLREMFSLAEWQL